MKTLNPTTKWILIAEFIIAVYMLIALVLSQYRSFVVEKYIDKFELENQELALKNEDLSDDYAYFTSPEYQEKIAKQNFGLINRGEEVLFIPASETVLDKDFEAEIEQEQKNFYQELNKPKKWWFYFFKA